MWTESFATSSKFNRMTKAIILAAGFGSRLRPLTDRLPKSMIKVMGLPLADRTIKVMKDCGINDITLISGYMSDQFEALDINQIENHEYSSSNMVYSLFCAEKLFDGKEDIIISYGDINYNSTILRNLLAAEGDIVISADKNWESLWSQRMEDYSCDVETFKVNENGCIEDLGRKAEDITQIEAQYMGLIRINKSIQGRIVEIYNKLLDREVDKTKNMFMTDFLRHLIDTKIKIMPSYTNGGWIEVDTIDDYKLYNDKANDFIRSNCNFITPIAPHNIVEDYLTNKYVDRSTDCIVNDFIQNIRNKAMIDNKTREQANMLSRKIEIAHIVWNRYDSKGKKTPESKEIGGNEYCALIASFLTLYERTKDLRYLNTALKGLDRTLIKVKMKYYYDLEYACEKELENVC